jgi:hypothetical protein
MVILKRFAYLLSIGDRFWSEEAIFSHNADKLIFNPSEAKIQETALLCERSDARLSHVSLGTRLVLRRTDQANWIYWSISLISRIVVGTSLWTMIKSEQNDVEANTEHREEDTFRILVVTDTHLGMLLRLRFRFLNSLE